MTLYLLIMFCTGNCEIERSEPSLLPYALSLETCETYALNYGFRQISEGWMPVIPQPEGGAYVMRLEYPRVDWLECRAVRLVTDAGAEQ